MPNTLDKSKLRQLADYCVSEGTAHARNGKWSAPYAKLNRYFGAEISDTNENGRLLREALQKEKEINELLMTEDCIEITYHLEFCRDCQQGGIEGTLDLLSLMGCNLYDVHFTNDAKDFGSSIVSVLNRDILTEEGKAEWSDVLSAKVDSLSACGNGNVACKLSQCDPSRVTAFAEMLNGQCEAEDYERWVRISGVCYAPARDRPPIQPDGQYSADLVASYEELLKVPYDQQLTAYFGDYGIHYFKYGITDEQIRPVYKKALATVEMTEAEFTAQSDRFRYRGEIVGRMRDCLLAEELNTGEEVLFVATEPYGGADDFALRGGIVLDVNAEQKTCKIRGEFFTMEDVPLHYVLGRHNLNTTGKHYGYEHVEPLFGERPDLAQQYLRKAQEDWEAKWLEGQEQGDEPPVLSM